MRNIMVHIHKRLILTLYLALTPLLLWAEIDTAKIKVEIQRIEHLATALNKGGIAELLETASRESIAVPMINSKYFAERIVKKEPALAPLEKVKRSFGYKLAQALDGVATNVQQKATSDVRVRQAEQLLNLGAWLKTEVGYGNYLLFARCESLTAVPLAYLIADLSFPLEKIAALRNRITTPSGEREFRRTVLNREAPKPFIDPLVGTDSEQDDQMQMASYKQWNIMVDWFEAHKVTRGNWKRSALPDDMAFFLDESLSGTRTTVESWDEDRHSSAMVNSCRDNNVEQIDCFFTYRQLVGKFPTTPPKWWKPDDLLHSKIEAAFMDAMELYRRKYGAIYGIAARIYVQVNDGTFMDWESHDKLLEEQAAKSLEERNKKIIEERNMRKKEPVNR